MVPKYVTKSGLRVHGPPYTKEEEADFYRRDANGPVTDQERPESAWPSLHQRGGGRLLSPQCQRSHHCCAPS
jgi:hypothetical protein